MGWLFSGAEKNHLSPLPVEKLKIAAIILLYFYHVFYIYFHRLLNLVAVYKFYCTHLFISGLKKTLVYLTTGVAHMPLPDTIFRKYL